MYLRVDFNFKPVEITIVTRSQSFIVSIGGGKGRGAEKQLSKVNVVVVVGGWVV